MSTEKDQESSTSDAAGQLIHNDNINEILDTEINTTAFDNELDFPDDCDMEGFHDYKAKIHQALKDIDMPNFNVEKIQHDSYFQNCVYAITSTKGDTKQYILRVPQRPTIRETDGRCEAIENDAFLLEYLQGKLPVPKIKAISSTKDNALDAPFMVQTRLPGQALSDLYDDLKHEEKMAIIEQFVDLIAQMESIQFDTAGTITASSVDIKFLDGGNTEYLKLQSTFMDRQGANLKAFLTSQIHSRVQKVLELENSEEGWVEIGYWKKLLVLLENLHREGAFAQSFDSIVLHHCDLEPRNILVEQDLAGAWRITGIIDWDDALALPRPLARKPPDWIWDFNSGWCIDLSHDRKELKARFDILAAERLDGYLEDAYGSGRRLRDIWKFAKAGMYSTSKWYLDKTELLFKDWEAQLQPVVPAKETA